MNRPRSQGTLRQKQPVTRDKKYLEFMKQLCIVHGCVLCGGEAERAHIRMAEVCPDCDGELIYLGMMDCRGCWKTGYRFGKLPTGMSERDDPWVLPVCPNHHRLLDDSQHSMNERQWWQKHGIDPLDLCHKLQQVYDPDNLALSLERATQILGNVR